MSNKFFKNLVIGKKYLTYYKGNFFVVEKYKENDWTISKLNRWKEEAFITVFELDWGSYLGLQQDDEKYCYKMRYYTNSEDLSNHFGTYVRNYFDSALISFYPSDLTFLGEYDKDTPLSEYSQYLNVMGISYKFRYTKRKEFLKEIYNTK